MPDFDPINAEYKVVNLVILVALSFVNYYLTLTYQRRKVRLLLPHHMEVDCTTSWTI
jgi:hypothetical protein